MTQITPTVRHRSAPADPAYRTDIDGLRVVAVLLVVIYHVWLGRVSGGVDVFLMISAFFLTGSLAKRAIAGDRLRLGIYWARRFRRLLPAAAVTLLGVLGAAYLFYPPTRWPRLWDETWASLLYVQNWQLAFSAVDYYARDATATSPLQHFWSLSVQGQVFLLWPLIIGVVAWSLRRRREWIRGALIAVFAVVFAASLAFSIVETARSQQFAYFDTRTRLWEFAAGSLLWLLLPSVRLPRWLRAALGWIGVAGIVLCGIVIDVRGGFPGYLALWPILSTAAIVISCAGDDGAGPARLLSARPFRALSGDAYALYLVHWPVLITWMVVADVAQVGPIEGGAIILGSLVLARILSRAVERPLHRAAWFDRAAWRSLLVIGSCIGLVGGTTAAWQSHEERRAAEVLASIETGDHTGAAQLGTGTGREADDTDAARLDTAAGRRDESLPMIPLPTELGDEWHVVGEQCSGRFAPSGSILAGTCVQSALAEQAPSTILVIGDSHAQQLSVPLAELAAAREAGVVALLKGGCTIGLDEEDRGVDGRSCPDWIAAALDYARDIEPDAVYVIVTRASPFAPERLLDGVVETLGAFADAGIPVIAVRDNPRFDFDMYTCVLESAASDCAVPMADVLAADNPADVLVVGPFGPDITLVDYTPWLCPGESCEGVIGNIAVYIDDNHLSRAYGMTLTPVLAEILEDAGVLSVVMPR